MTTASYISIFRIVLILPICYFIYVDSFFMRLLALFLFILAALSDYLDGYIARKYNQVSSLGSLLDLLADKLLVCILFIWLIFIYNSISFLIPVLMIVSREFLITSLRQLLAENKREYKIEASYLGKIKTTFHLVSIGLLIIFSDSQFFSEYMALFLLWTSAFLSFYSLYFYLVLGLKHFSED